MDGALGIPQEPLPPGAVDAIVARLLGPGAEVAGVDELPYGSYNTTLRVRLAGGSDVILRAGPRPERQLRSERWWLRAEHAAGPWLAGLGRLVPRVVAADFTGEVVPRDVLLLDVAPGVPAPDRMPGYDRAVWPALFAQLGDLSRRVHAVAGDRWGPLGEPGSGRWSDALHASVLAAGADLEQLGLPHGAAGRLADAVDRRRHRLDGLGAPRLLHGDLWTANVMLDPDAAEPTVVAVLDAERAWWGDPLADWSMYRADERAVTAEREAFWEGYGGRPEGGDTAWRRQLYRCRHLLASVVEHGRLGRRDDALAMAGALDVSVTDLG